jgi:preprotein translocase subunit SecF
VLFVGMGFGVISSIMFAAPVLSALKDQEPRIKAHKARVLARRAAVRSGDVAPRGERKRATAGSTAVAEVPEDAPVPSGAALAGSSPRPGARPTGNRNSNRGARPGGAGNRPSGGKKRR